MKPRIPNRKSASKTSRRAAWFIAASVWVAIGYVELNGHMMQLGAAHHDAFCTEH